MVTSRDVASLAGVSQATVSRVLHDSKKVTPATRERVLAALASSGYQPNAAAMAMRTNKTGSIGVVVDRIRNPFYPALLRLLGRELDLHDLRMILWDVDEGPGEQGAINAIDQRLIDGLVFTTATPGSSSLSRAVERNSPIVLTNRIVEGLSCDQVDSKNLEAASGIARYFRENGHEHVAVIGASTTASTAKQRIEGFVAGAISGGYADAKVPIVDGGFSHDGGYSAFLELMSMTPVPTAVFAVNDLSAFGALDAARAKGIRVPDDVWVAGFDDIEMASWEAYDLTTAHQSLADMARSAVELLMARIEDPSRPTSHIKIRSEIVVRGSTRSIPVA